MERSGRPERRLDRLNKPELCLLLVAQETDESVPEIGLDLPELLLSRVDGEDESADGAGVGLR